MIGIILFLFNFPTTSARSGSLNTTDLNHGNHWLQLDTWRNNIEKSELFWIQQHICGERVGDTVFGQNISQLNNIVNDAPLNFTGFIKIQSNSEIVCKRKKCSKIKLKDLEANMKDGVLEGVVNVTDLTGVTKRAYFERGLHGGLWIEELGGQVTSVGHVCSGQSWHWVDMLEAAVFKTDTFDITVFANKPEIVYHIKDNSHGSVMDNLEFTCDDTGVLIPHLDLLTNSGKTIKMLSKKILKHLTESEKYIYNIIKILNVLDNMKGRKEIGETIDQEWLGKYGQVRGFPFKDEDVPEYCRNLRTYSTRDNILLQTALVSYPGSGNTWLRYLVEAATGLVTTSGGPAILTKTHHMRYKTMTQGSEREDLWGRMKNLRKFSGRGILLIRNPVDAIRSWWNHKKDASEEPIDQDIDTPRFTRFVEAELDRWRDTALDWILLADHLLVVHYEDLLANPLLQVERIRTFLKLKEDKLRTKCVERSTFTAFKRVKKQNVKVKMNKMLKDKIIQDIWEIQNLLEHMGKKKMPIELFTKIIQNLT